MKTSMLLKFIWPRKYLLVPCKFKIIRGTQDFQDICSKIKLDNEILHYTY